jgi:DNA mismatch repair protein MutL
MRSTIKRSLGIYNVAPSLDFERDPKMETFFPSRSNPGAATPSAINVDRDFNPFVAEKISSEEKINLAELYEVTASAAPSKSIFLKMRIWTRIFSDYLTAIGS